PTFGGAIAVGGPRNGRAASRADVMITMPVPPAGTFRYSVYTGPLDYHQLSPMGHDLDDANPYGWSVFRPIIRPVSLFVTNILLWMQDRKSTRLNSSHDQISYAVSCLKKKTRSSRSL